MTATQIPSPINLGGYKPLSLDPANSTLTDEQRETLKANIQFCRDLIVFFTATGAARGVGGHTGGPYDTVPEVMILDAYIRTNGVDRPIMPVSRTEYASYSTKSTQGFPTVFWFDRLTAPTVTLWPVPADTGAQTLRYYRVRRIQDANLANGQNVEIPYRWLEALADGLTYRLARIWNPQIAVALKGQADESYNIAAFQDVENVNTFISPMIGSYFRN
jgi:hypothetical protein